MDSIPLDHAEVWDDSVLRDSWTEALEEYKKYHSIQANGGTVEDVENDLKALRSQWDAKPETEQHTSEPMDESLDNSAQPSGADGAVVSAPPPRSDETPSAEKVTPQETSAQQGADPSEEAARDFHAAAFAPESLMGTIQDDEMKSLMMSWYYAGYHTGLLEGKLAERRLHGKPSKG